MLLSIALMLCSGSFLHHGQSKHGFWHGSSSPPSWLQGCVFQGQEVTPSQKQPIHSIHHSSGWSRVSQCHNTDIFPSLCCSFFSIWHCFFSLFLPSPTWKHCVPDQIKPAQIHGAEGKQHGRSRKPITSQIFPTHLPGQQWPLFLQQHWPAPQTHGAILWVRRHRRWHSC